MRGNRIPTAIKQLQGTHHPSRDAPNSPPATGVAPINCPHYITTSDDGRTEEIYYQLISFLEGMKVLSKEDEFALAMLATTIHEVEICTAMIEDVGRTYVTTNQNGDKLIRGHPLIGQRADAMRRAQSLLGEFGLTPAARSKVSVIKDKGNNPCAGLDQ